MPTTRSDQIGCGASRVVPSSCRSATEEENLRYREGKPGNRAWRYFGSLSAPKTNEENQSDAEAARHRENDREGDTCAQARAVLASAATTRAAADTAHRQEGDCAC